MADFNFVTARLATGGAVHLPSDARNLRSAGVTHVLDCQELPDVLLFAEFPEMDLCWNGTLDDGLPKPAHWFRRSIDFALPALARPDAKVYCHCSRGVNRGPSTAYAILRALGVGPGDAELFVRRARPKVGLAYMRDADRAVQALGYV